MNPESHVTTWDFKRWLLQPWGLFALGALCLSLIVVVLVVTDWLVPERLAINDRRLPDGSILRIEAVTWGKLHEVFVPTPRTWTYWDLYSDATEQQTPLRLFASDDRLVVTMSRRDSRTGQPLDFDWWQSCHVVDAYGDELREEKATLWEITEDQAVSREEPRPMKANHKRYRGWCGQSVFHPFRSERGRFTLKVEDATKAVVATIPLDCSNLPTTPSWDVEPFPVSRSSDELSITLTGLEVHPGSAMLAGKLAASSPFLPQCQLSWNGQPTDDWYVETAELSDVFGNLWHTSTRLPSFKEPAWKLHLRVFHKPGLDVFVDHHFTTREFEIPEEPGQLREYGDYQDFGGVSANAYAISSIGRHRPYLAFRTHELTSTGKSLPAKITGTVFGSPYEISYHSPSIAELRDRCVVAEFDSQFPTICLSQSRTSSEKLLEFRLKDDRGRDIPFEYAPLSNGGWRWCFMKAEPDARAVRLTYIVQEARHFEFFVKPPEMPEGTKKQ